MQNNQSGPAYHLKAVHSMQKSFKAREKAYRVVLAATQDFLAGRLSKEGLSVVVDEFEDRLL